MASITRLAERDGWWCWLCEQPIDPLEKGKSPGAATIDHVVPRSRGGTSDATNLRLAHRRCNGNRGDHLPELEWPASFDAVEAGDLWVTIARLVKNSPSPEIAALFPTQERAEAASKWAVERACAFVGGQWTGWVEPRGPAWALLLHVVDGADAGRPRSRRADTSGHARRRRRR